MCQVLEVRERELGTPGLSVELTNHQQWSGSWKLLLQAMRWFPNIPESAALSFLTNEA